MKIFKYEYFSPKKYAGMPVAGLLDAATAKLSFLL
jgi:hypothetical protein